MEKKEWREKLGELSFMKGYYFKLEDNGLVEKKDDQLVFNREELEHFIAQELDKAKEEGRREGSEITSRYISDFVKEESGKSGRKEILEYIKELSKLKDNK